MTRWRDQAKQAALDDLGMIVGLIVGIVLLVSWFGGWLLLSGGVLGLVILLLSGNWDGGSWQLVFSALAVGGPLFWFHTRYGLGSDRF